jgi:hypothetical protein
VRAGLLVALVGCTLPDADATGLAAAWVTAPGHTGDGFHDADRAVNGVRGGGDRAGSTDVYSLSRGDDLLVVGWGGARLFDAEGDDFAVFENPFDIAGGGRFVDPVEVAVSPDGLAWVSFDCWFDGEDPRDPSAWSGCAGITPVRLHEEDNPVDPLSDEAGGDRFDLADLPAGAVRDRIDAEGVVAVRLRAADGPVDPASNGPDIDGIYAR